MASDRKAAGRGGRAGRPFDLTEDFVHLQFGGLILAGFSPREIMSWTWPEIAFAGKAAQTFLVDTVTMFATGKSPVMKEAQKAYRDRVNAARIAVDLKAQKGDLSREDAVKIAQDYDALGQLARMGIGIRITGGSDPHLQAHLQAATTDRAVAEAFGVDPPPEAPGDPGKPPGRVPD